MSRKSDSFISVFFLSVLFSKRENIKKKTEVVRRFFSLKAEKSKIVVSLKNNQLFPADIICFTDEVVLLKNKYYGT